MLNVQRSRQGAALVAALLLACAGPAARAPQPTSSPPAPPSSPVEPIVASAKAEPTTAEILAASHLPAAITHPLADDPMQVTVHRLANGLTVYISPMPSETSLQAWTVVRSGARNDPADATGLAHYLEHMNFKGTGTIGTHDYASERPHLDKITDYYARLRGASEGERAGILATIDAENQEASKYSNPGELSQLYERLGISRFDAFTSTDVTAYTHEVPANLVGVWAQVEAERYRAPAFREFYSELESVYEERNMRDTPERRVWEADNLGLFPEHPYGTQTVIGTVDHLKTPRFAEMLEYFKSWYVPNNMAIVLVGAVDTEKTVAALDKAFASWTPRPLPAPPPGRIVPLTGRVEKEVLDKGQQTITLSWLLPRGSYDGATWDLLSELLGSQGGLLQKQLVLTQKVPWVRAFIFEQKDASRFMIQAGLADHQTHEQAEQLIVEVLDRVTAGDFPEELVPTLALNRHVATQLELESAESRASLLQDAFSGDREWADDVARVKRRELVSKTDIAREAKAHLGKAYVAVYRKQGDYVPPKVDKPKITPIAITRKDLGDFAQSILKLPVEPIEPHFLENERDFQRGKLITGPLVTSRNETSDLYEVTYLFEGGLTANPRLCWALQSLHLTGTRELSAVAVQEKLYGLATRVTGGCESDLAYLTVSGADTSMEPALAFVRAWLAAPRIEAGEVQRAIANEMRSRREYMDQKEYRQGAAYDYLLHGKDSAYLKGVLSNRELQALTPDAVSRELTSLSTLAHTTLYFGPRPLDQVAPVVAFGSARRPGVPARARVLVRSRKPEILFVPFVSADARVYLSIPGGKERGPDRASARMFGTFAHRYTWEEVREARGLAYSVSTWYSLNQRSQDEGGVVSSVASQADKLPEMLPFLLSLLADLRPSQTRFESAKTSLETIYRTTRSTPREVPRQVYGWGRLGLDRDPRPGEWEAVRAATIDTLTRFSLRVTKAAPFRIVVIGDPARIDLAALRKIVPVRELTPESLFGYGAFPPATP